MSRFCASAGAAGAAGMLAGAFNVSFGEDARGADIISICFSGCAVDACTALNTNSLI
jgi:hypothetical protein